MIVFITSDINFEFNTVGNMATLFSATIDLGCLLSPCNACFGAL